MYTGIIVVFAFKQHALQIWPPTPSRYYFFMSIWEQNICLLCNLLSSNAHNVQIVVCFALFIVAKL